MNSYNDTYKGLRAYYLENETLKLIVLPDLGGKIASLIFKPQNFEVFFQPADGNYKLAEYGGDFSQYDTSGADEMYPTIDSCLYPDTGYEGKLLPDHGELWSLPWLVAKSDTNLYMARDGVTLPYRFTKVITLSGNRVHMEYTITNKGNQPLFGLWAFHGLVACDESTHFDIPNCRNVITVHNSEILGLKESEHSYPVTVDQDGNEYILSRVAPRSSNKTEKFYVAGAVKTGKAALTLNQGRLLYQLRFPSSKVPYLGVWINEGGFKGEYNCALEPSTGYYDSLATAYQYNRVSPLAPGKTLDWYLDIELESLIPKIMVR